MALGAILGAVGGIANGVTGIFTAKENRKTAEVQRDIANQQGITQRILAEKQLEAAKLQAESDKLNGVLQLRMAEHKSKQSQATLAYVGAFVVVLLIFFK
ncbi:hypothetical protein BKI52_33075 [marine bacterium AO1-C]|nr:hypothetical protein BKI52_33075 [marine bacterium AO1-C]